MIKSSLRLLVPCYIFFFSRLMPIFVEIDPALLSRRIKANPSSPAYLLGSKNEPFLNPDIVTLRRIRPKPDNKRYPVVEFNPLVPDPKRFWMINIIMFVSVTKELFNDGFSAGVPELEVIRDGVFYQLNRLESDDSLLAIKIIYDMGDSIKEVTKDEYDDAEFYLLFDALREYLTVVHQFYRQFYSSFYHIDLSRGDIVRKSFESLKNYIEHIQDERFKLNCENIYRGLGGK